VFFCPRFRESGRFGARTCASGVMCPMQKPWVPPEKRPSVMSATCAHARE
jgi:hypothetical protein